MTPEVLALVRRLLSGDAANPLFLQPAPVEREVWLAFAESAGKGRLTATLLLRPFRDVTAAAVARDVLICDPSRLAQLPGIVLCEVDFTSFLKHILPLTQWWRDLASTTRLGPGDISLQLDCERPRDPGELPPAAVATDALDRGPPYDLCWLATLAGTILAAAKKPKAAPTRASSAAALGKALGKSWPVSRGQNPHVFRIAHNREIKHAAAQPFPDGWLRSARTIKADAARRLFDVNCAQVCWAIVDTGIADLPAFRGTDTSRVVATYDLTRLIELTEMTGNSAGIQKLLEDEAGFDGVPPDAARQWAIDRLAELPLVNSEMQDYQLKEQSWSQLEPLVRSRQPRLPAHSHGTQVASILAARAKPVEQAPVANLGQPDPVVALAREAAPLVAANRPGKEPGPPFEGICPEIRLVDFRVFSADGRGQPVATEFHIIGALQLIRYLHRSGLRKLDGVNLSLSVRQEVESYACGSSLVCEECNKTVESGLVVVAAAGNDGHKKFLVGEEAPSAVPWGAFADGSITDPGNADLVITVGATHATDPHRYGVSYFSSRGPTGDGRAKPDLLAPGERVCCLDRFGDTVVDVGTSFAAPHVSAAAAMLLARAPELAGRPQLVKDILCRTATDLKRVSSYQGHGLLDVLRALQAQ